MKLEEKRQEILDSIPKTYSPLKHVLINIMCSIFAISISISEMHFNILFGILFSSLFLFYLFIEYFVHKYFLHRKILSSYYNFHTTHHVLYTHDSMRLNSWKELCWILIPQEEFTKIYLFVALVFSSIHVFSAEIASIFIFTTFVFYIFYELAHLSWHLGPKNRFGKYHTIHHNPENMRKVNMNVTIPIVDWLLGTLKSS